ncbi:hypothetical protein ACFWZU_16055 [Frateuria sp. GZRR33]|uniref:hypothetical protein n=1 Tax=Frateuria sp. GZRR33 TaxID=3351535 RepID=UPI003EDC76E2
MPSVACGSRHEPGGPVEAADYTADVRGQPVAQVAIAALCWIDPAAPGNKRSLC